MDAKNPAMPPLPPLPDDDGWIAWGDSACPVPHDTPIEIKLRNGSTREVINPQSYRWNANGSSYDIVAYRVIGDSADPFTPEDKAQPTQQAINIELAKLRFNVFCRISEDASHLTSVDAIIAESRKLMEFLTNG